MHACACSPTAGHVVCAGKFIYSAPVDDSKIPLFFSISIYRPPSANPTRQELATQRNCVFCTDNYTPSYSSCVYPSLISQSRCPEFPSFLVALRSPTRVIPYGLQSVSRRTCGGRSCRRSTGDCRGRSGRSRTRGPRARRTSSRRAPITSPGCGRPDIRV